jgi:hypothetical protein
MQDHVIGGRMSAYSNQPADTYLHGVLCLIDSIEESRVTE